ncbi:hypothetical protein L1887_15907 [Cichorium endivia]|nr:hypothetical protein L1887_15907 [Cichorium endivia]
MRKEEPKDSNKEGEAGGDEFSIVLLLTLIFSGLRLGNGYVGYELMGEKLGSRLVDEIKKPDSEFSATVFSLHLIIINCVLEVPFLKFQVASAMKNADHHNLIRHTYAENYKDLLKALERFPSNFESIILLRTLDPPERDAFLANEATKKGVKSNQVLAEIACTRSSKDLLLAKKAYLIRYQKSMEEDAASSTTRDFQKVVKANPLVKALVGQKDELTHEREHSNGDDCYLAELNIMHFNSQKEENVLVEKPLGYCADAHVL